MIDEHYISLMNKLREVKNIIFDMDGTLIDTSKISVKACQQSASEFGLPIQDQKKIIGLIGWADPEFYYRLYPNVDKSVIHKYASVVAKREQEYIKELREKALFPGIAELIKTLKSNGFYLCIASTGSLAHVHGCLEATCLKNEFDIIKCNEPLKIRMVKEIIKGGPTGEWLMIGDRSKDFEAGNSNGIITIGAAYGFGTETEMKQFDLEINSPLKLLKLLQVV